MKKLVVFFILFTFYLSPSQNPYWQWAQSGTCTTTDNGTAVTSDNSGNVYVTGESVAPVTLTDYFTIKYNSNGDTLWTRRYDGGDNPSSAP